MLFRSVVGAFTVAGAPVLVQQTPLRVRVQAGIASMGQPLACGVRNGQAEDYSLWVGPVAAHKPSTVAISVYPNPAKDNLAIEGSFSKAGYAEVEIRNTLGQLVSKSKKAHNGHLTTALDIRNLPAGYYHLHIVSGLQTSRTIFTVQR